MKKLSLSDVGNVAQAIAAVAVVVSIVYLGVQIQQNTKAVRASSYQEVANGITSFQMALAESEELSSIYLQASENASPLSPEEMLRFEMTVGQLFVKYDVAIYFHRRGLINDAAIDPYTRFILRVLETPGATTWWEEVQSFFSEDMRSYVNEQRKG